MSGVRTHEDPSAFGDILDWLRQRPLVMSRALAPEFPSTLSALKPRYPDGPRNLPTVTCEREIAWAGARLRPHVKKLSIFTKRATDFGRARIENDYDRCSDILSDIENQLGWSLWLVRQRLNIRQAQAGVDGQKRYLSQLYNDGLGGTAAFYAHFVSQLNEPNLTPSRYRQNYLQWESEVTTPPDFRTYLNFLALRQLDLDEDGIAAILNHQGSGAIVDLYEALIVAGQNLAADTRGASITYAKLVEPLSRKIADPRLLSILHAVGARIVPPLADARSLDAYDQLLKGDVDRALNRARSVLSEHSDDPLSMEIAAKAIAHGAVVGPDEGLPSFGHELLEEMVSLISRRATLNEDAQELTKWGILYAGLPWADALVGFLERENGSHALGVGPASARGVSIAGCLHPVHVAQLPPGPHRRNIASACVAAIDAESEGVAFAAELAGVGADEVPLLTSLEPEARAKLRAVRMYESGEYEAALGALSQITNRLEHHVLRLSAHCLLNLGAYQGLIRLIASAYVSDRRLFEVLPVSATAAAISRETRLLLAKDVGVPIFYDLYASHVGPDRESERVYAAEDFLLAHGIDKPSDLEAMEGRFDRAMLIYFLRYVCVEAVLDTHIAYSGSQDVRDERVSICRLLSRLDPDEAETYQAEIKDLLRKTMIQRRMREVEQSKIYVDIDGVRRTAETLRESYDRYTALLRAGVQHDRLIELEKVVRQAIGEEQLLVIKWTGGANRDILSALLHQLRDLYVSSAEHGLDKYLSVRIRHQTLAGQLRKPLEEASLITQLDKETSKYKPNVYWLARVGVEGEPEAEALDHIFESFARAFDGLVATVRDEWVQVRTESTSRGMFDFRMSDRFVFHIVSSVDADTTFDTFVNLVLDGLGVVLDENLKTIRQRIDGEVKSLINAMFHTLHTDVERLSPILPVAELIKSIRDAHTAMQVVIDRVVSWFQRAKAVANEPFVLTDAIHISEQMVRSGLGFATAMASVSGEPLQLPGRRFNDYVDIMSTIFENIVRHSGQPYPSASVSIRYFTDNIHIRVENDVSDDVVLNPNSESRLDRIRTSLADGQFRVSVAREGGTGFYKIGKILDDFGSRRTLSFGFVDGCRFFVQFDTPVPEAVR